MKKPGLVLSVSLAAASVCWGCTRDLATTAGAAADVNDDGVAVGWLGTDLARRAVKFLPDGTIVELALPNGCTQSYATTISNQGEIAGVCTVGDFRHVVHWDASGAPRDLGKMGFHFAEFAVMGINNHGVIVGYVAGAVGSGGTFAWAYDTRARTQIELPVGPDVRYTRATGINDRGEIVGTVELYTLQSVAVKWAPVTRALTRLPFDSRCPHMFATGINSLGAVVGQCDVSGSASDPVVWPANGGPPRLLEHQSEVDYYVQSINDEGAVVGVALGQSAGVNAQHAVRWTSNGTRTTYPTPFTSAAAINGSGYTVGSREVGGQSRPIAIAW